LDNILGLNRKEAAPMLDSDGGTREPLQVPVLVVGGGPAGLTMALELARRGIDGLLIERRGFTNHYPRAHLLNVRTMETFHDVGVAEEIYAQSPPEDQWHRVAWYTSLAGPTPQHGLKIGHVQAWGGGTDLGNYRLASPRPFANLPQIRLDRILWEHADRSWPGRVRGHSELIALEHDGSGVTATIRDTQREETYQVRARYVVAADGGRTCADLLGVELLGPRALLDLVNVYFSADLAAHADEEALITYFVNPEGQGSFSGALLGLGPGPWGARCREWSMTMAFRVGDPAGEDEASLIGRVRRTLGVPDLDIDLHAISHWQFEGVVAERFRVSSVLLVGDAAHRHPPTGGLGLNTAIGDVGNLAWKLAAVLDGYADDSLLDTYEAERKPVAARNIEHSLRNAGRHGPVAASLGLRAGIGEDEGWREIAVWASDTPEGERRRAASAQAVAANAEDYSQLNIEAGFAYEFGAVVPDGTAPPPHHHTATIFEPSARPGHHIPNCRLERRGETVSTVDLVAPTGFTVFAPVAAETSWNDAAEQAAAATGCPVTVVTIGLGGDVTDPGGEWPAVSGTRPGGCLLVRPDRHVAWRAADGPAEPEAELTRIVRLLLAGGGREIRPGDDPLAGITEAGEALRTGGAREARIFTSTTPA
jgi:2,4-dichlorophenol 6-monooxygenase